jgi:three-Cys-motif partner protein
MAKAHEDYWGTPELHTEIKHKILTSYLGGWTYILGRKAKALYYIDTHAGRGKHITGELGSPILAMQAAQEALNKRPDITLDYYFHNVEANQDNFESLVNEVNAYQSLYPDFHVTNYFGNFQTHTGTILDKIPTDRASFIFIDPFGYKDPYIPDILPFVANRRYSEVFIIFMSQWIAQYLSDKTKAENFDMILSSTEWRNFIGKPDSEMKVVDLYSRQIRDAAIKQEGRNFWVYPIRIKDRIPTATYFLIHLTQDPKGRIVMEKAERSALFKGAAEPLFVPTHIEDSVLAAVKRRSGDRVIDIAGDVWQQYPTASFVDQITKTLKNFYKDDIIMVKEKDGAEKKKTLKPDEDDKVIWLGKELGATQNGLF